MDEIFALQSNAHVLRYWDAPLWRERVRAEQFITGCRQMAEEGTGARLAVDRGVDGRFIGWCTLNAWNPDYRSASLGFCFDVAAWGHGYTTEAARVLLSWAFENAGPEPRPGRDRHSQQGRRPCAGEARFRA